MPKLFYMPLYTKEWRSDPKLSRCSLSAKGAWIALCAVMWDDDQRGEVIGTIRDLASACGAQVDEFGGALLELQQKGVADISPDLAMVDDRRTQVTVVSRRLKRLYEEREQAATAKELRKTKNKLEKDPENPPPKTEEKQKTLTMTIDSLTSGDLFSGRGAGEGAPPEPESFDFEAVYALYPRHEGKAKGMAIAEREITSRIQYDRLMAAVRHYCESKGPRQGFVMLWSTFLGGRWLDYVDGPVNTDAIGDRDYENFSKPRGAVAETKDVKL